MLNVLNFVKDFFFADQIEYPAFAECACIPISVQRDTDIFVMNFFSDPDTTIPRPTVEPTLIETPVLATSTTPLLGYNKERANRYYSNGRNCPHTEEIQQETPLIEYQ
jgi:hypothetical protein